MSYYAYDIYSGFIEDTQNVIGSRDVTLVERYQRLGDYSQRTLGLPSALMQGWEDGIEEIILNPPKKLSKLAQAIAILIIMRDAGQRRFRIISEHRDDALMMPLFKQLAHPEFCADLLNSKVANYGPFEDEVRWGFLDVEQIKTLLQNAFGNDSFMQSKTAVIAGRLSHMSRSDAETALIDVGIETQNSISHNVDYLILGSKGTGGTKHEKVQKLKDAGQKVRILDEDGFDDILRSPKKPLEIWPTELKQSFEDFVSSLRHVWAFGLDLYCLSYAYDPEENIL